MKRCLFIIVSLLASLVASAEAKVVIDDINVTTCYVSRKDEISGIGRSGGKYLIRSDTGFMLYLSCNFSTQVSEPHSYLVGVGLFNESGLLQMVNPQWQQRSVNLSAQNKADYSDGLQIDNSVPDGDYRLVLLVRENENEEWTPCDNSSEYYVEVKISGNWLKTRRFPLSEEEKNILDYGLNVIDGINYNIYSVYGRNEAMVYPLDTEKYEGDVYIPDSVKFDGKYFSVTKAVSYCFDSSPNLTSLSLAIPELESIYYDKKLQKLDLREGVTFFKGIDGFDSLESIDLPKSLSEIYGSIAGNCKSLKTIRFKNPKLFTWVGGHINWGEESLPALSDVYFTAPEAPHLWDGQNIQIHPTAIIHVPEGRKTVYENAGWKGWNIVDDQPLPEADGIEWGYCSGDNVDHLGLLVWGGDDDVEFAIHAPSETLAPYKGKQISAIEFYDRKSFWDTGEDPEKPDYLFVTTPGTDYLIKQAVTDTRKGWNKITLETPYTITGEELFVGIGRHKGLEINFTDLNATAPDGFWLRYMGTDDGDGVIPGKWYNATLKSTDFNHPIPIRFIIAGDDLPYDILLEKVQLYSNGMLLNTPTGEDSKAVKVENGTDEGMILMTANVKSRTKEIIRSYTINWQIDGQQTGSKTITTSLPANTVEPISIEIPASLVNRDHVFTYSVTDINGHADAVAMNSSGSIAFRAQAKQYFPRKVVMEEGTGTWCGYCPRGIVAIEQLQKKYPDNFIAIGIHAIDEMGNAENYDKIRDQFFVYGFPRCIINRTKDMDPESSDVESIIKETKDYAESKITASAVFDDADSTFVTVSTETVFGFSDEGADIRVAYVVVEDHVGPYKQLNYYSFPYSSGMGWWNFKNQFDPMYDWFMGEPEVETFFNNVARGIYDGVDGIKLSIPSTIVAGETYQYQYRIALPDNIQNKKNIRIITLLIDNKSGELLNADSYDMVEDDFSSIEPNNAEFEFRYDGNSLEEGATVVIKAEKDENGEINWTTNPESNPKNGLILATLDGKKQLGQARLEILNSSFQAELPIEEKPELIWKMGNMDYIFIDPESGGDNRDFSTDDEGIVMVQLYTQSLRNEGFIDACLTGAINGKKRTVNIKFVNEADTAIKDIQKGSKPFDVYSLNGVKLRSGVTSLDGLPRGLYIVNGRKIVK